MRCLAPPFPLGASFALGILVAQAWLAAMLDFVPRGVRAQGTGAAMSTALFLLAGYTMGCLRRQGQGRTPPTGIPWRSVCAFSAVLTVMGLAGTWGNFNLPLFPAHADGGMARGMLAANAVALAPMFLTAVGAALGAGARKRTTVFGFIGAVTLLVISFGIREAARYLLLDPNVISLVATGGLGVAALLVGFVLSWAHKRLAFVEMAITALLVGYAIYLTVAMGPTSLVVSWSLPIEQILLALSFVPSIALMALLAVGGSLGFLLFGSGRWDPGFQYELKVATRYLQVNFPQPTRRTWVGLVHAGFVVGAVWTSLFLPEPQLVWWGTLLGVLVAWMIVRQTRWLRLALGLQLAFFGSSLWGVAQYGARVVPKLVSGSDTVVPAGAVGWTNVALGGLVVLLYGGLWAIITRRLMYRHIGLRTRTQKPLFVGVVTVISVLGVAIGVMALIVVLSVMSGFEADLKSKILGAHAHIIVEKYGDDFVEYEAVERTVRTVPEVQTAAAFVLGDAMITTDEGLIAGTLVKGIDPGSEDAVVEIRRNLLRGDVRYLEQPDQIPGACSGVFKKLPKFKPPPTKIDTVLSSTSTSSSSAQLPDTPVPVDSSNRCSGRVLPGVLIGRELANQLGARVGYVVKLISPVSEEIGPMGPTPKLRRFRVAGVFFSGMYEYDAKHAYISMGQAQKFFGKRGRASGVELKISDIDLSALVASDINRRLGGQPYHVRDWRDMHKELFSALLLEKIAMFVALAMIIMVASFLIVATLVIIVLQRGREIAILKSVGASDASIMKIFVIQGVIVGLSGSLLGVGAGVAICLLVEQVGLQLDNSVFYIELLPVALNWSEVGVIAVSAIIITYLATIYPAMTAAVLKPVEGLREE